MRAAQANMRQPAVKRFYEVAEAREKDGRFALLLDGRQARTPSRDPLTAKSRALMEMVAAEWARQGDLLRPADMPLTRLLNAALHGVQRTMSETRAEILKYAGSDLLCYRAEEPEALVRRQAEGFDPVLRWATEALGAHFRLSAGVRHVEQPRVAIEAIRAAVEVFDDPIALAGLSVMTTLTGSALLALAVARRRLPADEAWRLAHVDEDFQAERWGADAEAAARREARWREFEAAAVAARTNGF